MIDAGIAERAREKSIPISAYAELTYACNWRCLFCYNPRRNDIRRMRLADWTAVLDSLRRLGTLQLALTGGEPLAHPDFYRIAHAARERAFALRIFTNGALIDDGAAAGIAGLDPLTVEMSLHGATAAVHDQATATPGSFDAMWRAIERLLRFDVRLVLKAPVTSMNEHELEAMVELCETIGLPLRLDANITPRDDGDAGPLRYRASFEARQRVLEIAARLGTIRLLDRSEARDNCGIGRLTVVIDPEGNVYPCTQWRSRPIGNVCDNDLYDIWRSSEERSGLLRTSVEVNDAMRALGKAADAFPFCPAIAMQRTGDPLVPDEHYLENAAIAREILTS